MIMAGMGFGKIFKGGNVFGKKQPEREDSNNTSINIQNNSVVNKGSFKLLGSEKEKKYIQEMCNDALDRSKYIYSHADIFCKFSDVALEDFKIQIREIQSEIEEVMKHGKFKEFNKIKMLNNWFVEQEKLLDQRVLYPINQQCQEMHDLLVRHADKSRFFDTRSPEQFKAWLEKMRENHRLAQSQLQAYVSGEASISTKDNTLKAIRKIYALLKAQKGSLKKYLWEVRASAKGLQKEIDQRCSKLLLHAEQSLSFTDQNPEEFKKSLKGIKDSSKAAIAQIGKYLSGVNNTEDKKIQAFQFLEKNLNYLKEIEKNLALLSDVRTNADSMLALLQKTYEKLFNYADQSLFFINQEEEEFRENLERIKNGCERAYAYIERSLSGKSRDETNQLLALQDLEKYLNEIKELESHLDTFLLDELSTKIDQTYHKLLKHVEQSQYFTEQQRQYFIDDLKDMNNKYNESKLTIKQYINIRDTDDEKKYNEFSLIETIKKDLDISLMNQTNAEIVQICNRLNKYEQYIAMEERGKWRFKDRLESIENKRKDANEKYKQYISGDDISEEDKDHAFRILEKCLEEARIVEIDMAPLLKDPMIQKIDQNYDTLVQNVNKHSIFTKQELQELNKIIIDVKQCISVNSREEKANKLNKSLKEKLNMLDKLERKIAHYLQLQDLRNEHIKISNSIEKYLNNTANFDADRIDGIRKILEPSITRAENNMEDVKKALKNDTIAMHTGYLGELSLNEYSKSIESLRKQVAQMFGINKSGRLPKSK
jgi:hypothetical protein